MKLAWLFAAVVVVWALVHTGQAQEQIIFGQEEDDRYVTCSLSGDPHVLTFNGQYGNVPFPCFSHLADLRLEFDAGMSSADRGYDFFIINVYTSAGIQAVNGRYYVDYVTVEIGGYGYIEGSDKFTLVDKGTYKTSSINVETFLNSGQTPQDEDNVWDTNSTFEDDIVRTGYDATEMGAFLKLWRHNNPPLDISFHPRDKSKGIPQIPRPGVFIAAKKVRMKEQPEAKFPKSLCSTRTDDRTFREIKNLGIYGDRLDTNRDLMLFTVYSQAMNLDVAQTEPKCDDAVAAFARCAGDAKRQQAMFVCSPLTTAGNVRCLEDMVSEPGNALVAFTKCINVCCEVDKVNSQSWLNAAMAICPRITLPAL